jgi:hypothetical protein
MQKIKAMIITKFGTILAFVALAACNLPMPKTEEDRRIEQREARYEARRQRRHDLAQTPVWNHTILLAPAPCP